MKVLKGLPLVFLISGFILLFSFSEPLYLIKIPKSDLAQWSVLQKFQIDIAQELETCYLARAGREEFRVLRQNRVRFSILDKDIQGKEYFLVQAGSLKALAALQAKGQLRAVEKETILCWTKEGDPAAILPPDVVRKPLPSDSLLPYIKRPSPPLTIQAPEELKNDLVQFIVNQVSRDNLRSLVSDLELFQTRYASTANCEAAGEFIYLYFQTLGLNPRYEPFTFRSVYSSRNIIAEKTGQAYPDDVVIICGHYDSYSRSAATLAPGADDNASGTAAVMEAARILMPYNFDFTIRFIAFSAEEWGLYGSQYHASRARARQEKIVGVINLDMIAYADAIPEDLELFVNQDSEWLAERLGLAARSYTGLPFRKIIDASMVYSDHAPFWDTGYPALLGIEDMPLRNPYYHQTTDTIDTLNFDFFTSSAKTALGALAELAQPVRTGYPKTPAGLEAKAYLYSSLFNSLKTVHLSWTASPDAQGYNIYRSTTSHLNYQKINSSPVQSAAFLDRILKTDIPHFYAVTALGYGGLESNFSREVKIEAAQISPPRTSIQTFSLFERRGSR